MPDIKKTAELVAEISAACREQDVGADQINQAIQQLDKVTQQNASASEQMSATSEELAAQAEQLQASIAYFRIAGAITEHSRGTVRRPALETHDNPHAEEAPRHRLSRDAPALVPPKSRLAVAAKADPTRNGQMRGGQQKKREVGSGFALKLAHADDDHHDADFVKY